jgi:hypothetical protein
MANDKDGSLNSLVGLTLVKNIQRLVDMWEVHIIHAYHNPIRIYLT